MIALRTARLRLPVRFPSPDERGGSSTIDTLLIVPIIVVLLSLATAGFRIAMAGDAVEGAAGAAARAASLARSAGQARGDAHSVAAAALATSGLSCSTTSVRIDTGGFSVPVGQPARVSVTVSCDAPLADLLVPGLGGSRHLAASADSPLDTYRERQ